MALRAAPAASSSLLSLRKVSRAWALVAHSFSSSASRALMRAMRAATSSASVGKRAKYRRSVRNCHYHKVAEVGAPGGRVCHRPCGAGAGGDGAADDVEKLTVTTNLMGTG